MSSLRLTPAQARVLGSLLEKEAATPDYYPLSLNALTSACNQRSNRDPVMELREEEILEALHALETMRLAGRLRSGDGRVARYEHWLGEAYNLTRGESALLCVLLLRGAQTPGELRTRAERMHSFAELSDTVAALEKMMQRTPPLAAVLPRQPGARESRYIELLSITSEPAAKPAVLSTAASQSASPALSSPVEPATARAQGSASGEERLARLEAQVQDLTERLQSLAARFEDLFGDEK